MIDRLLSIYLSRPSRLHKALSLKTISEMAADLRVSVRTFRQDVKEKKIPFVIVGKRKRFDPEKVKVYLSAVDQSRKPKAFAKRVRPVSKYAEVLGL